MRKLLVAIGALLGLLLLAALLVPLLLPRDALEAEIEARASEALGRTVTIDGPPDIRLFPTQLRVNGLTVANAEGFDAPYLLSVDEAAIGVRLLPLLSRRVEITRFDLDAPDIRLQADEQGRANWTLGPDDEAQSERDAEAGALPDVSLGTVRITDAEVSYEGPDGQRYEAGEADVTIRAPSLDAPLAMEGTLRVEGRPARFDTTVTTPRRLAENGTGDLEVTVQLGENAVEAAVTLGEALAFYGRIDAELADLHDLMALAGAEPPASGFERLQMAGDVSGDADTFRFRDGTRVAFDEVAGEGTLTIETGGDKPMISGTLTTGVLDLRPYLPEGGEEATEPSEGFPPWSEEVIDLSALGLADADLRLAAAGIRLPQIAVGRSVARLSLRDAQLAFEVDQMALYEGSGSGNLRVDASGEAPRIAARFSLAGVDAGALARDAAGIQRLEGRGTVALDLAGSGGSQAALVRSLSGTVSADLGEGAIRGVNIGRIANGVAEVAAGLQAGEVNLPRVAATLANAAETARGPAQATDFSSLDLDLALEEGVATTRTLRLEGPSFLVTGEGTADLPQQTARLTLMPSAALPGETTRRELLAPILVTGTFSDPKIGVDAAPLARGAVLRGAEGVLGRVGVEVGEGERVEDALRRRAADELGRVLGAPDAEDGEDADAGAEDPRTRAVREGLGAILGGRRGDRDDADAAEPTEEPGPED